MDWSWHPKLKLCVQKLYDGGVITYPTEAVWGLGCDPFNRAAVEQILTLKQRPVHKGLILVAGELSQIDFLLDSLNRQQLSQLEQSWPGHTTWLIPHNAQVPEYVTGKFDSVAVRVSTHPVIQALCKGFRGPIVSTSANPQGLPPAASPMMARRYFGKQSVLFCPGNIGKNNSPSVIKDLLTGRIIRA